MLCCYPLAACRNWGIRQTKAALINVGHVCFCFTLLLLFCLSINKFSFTSQIFKHQFSPPQVLLQNAKSRTGKGMLCCYHLAACRNRGIRQTKALLIIVGHVCFCFTFITIILPFYQQIFVYISKRTYRSILRHMCHHVGTMLVGVGADLWWDDTRPASLGKDPCLFKAVGIPYQWKIPIQRDHVWY